MSKTPLLSVTVPTLNEARYVQDALQALHADPFVKRRRDAVEVILVDSGSTDGTVEAARPLVDRVIHVGWGKLHARNAAVHAARAPIVAWMDADVRVHAGSIERLVKRFHEDPRVVAVGSYTRYAHPVIDAARGAQDAVGRLFRNLNGRFGAVRREVFLAIGGFDESLDCTSLTRMVLEEQVRFAWRLSREGRIAWDPGIVHTHSDRRILWMIAAQARDMRYGRSLGVERF